MTTNFQEFLIKNYTTATLAMRLNVTTSRAMDILRGEAQSLTFEQINRLFTDMSVKNFPDGREKESK